ncbi:MAG: hypothetical protein WEB19_01230 [Acidimicrobiia bacterium]
MDRRIALLAGIALAATVITVPPAFACSCAQATIHSVVERDPEVAIAVVRRVDRDGGAEGIGRVERPLRGALPDEVPLDLDTGASCKPWLGAGQIATLAFEPAGETWRTMDCGMLDPATSLAAAYGDFAPDPDARGDPAVLLGGPLPGADLVLLDAHLDVLAVSPEPSGEPSGVSHIERCGRPHALVVGTRAQVPLATLRTLPDLEVVAERRLGGVANPQRVLDVACHGDGRVAAVTTNDAHGTPLTWYGDLFGDDPRELPPAEDAAIVGDEVLLLRSDHDGRMSSLDAFDPVSGTTTRRVEFDGMAAYELTVAPDGAHVTVRGFAEEPVLLVVEIATGEVVGRSTGWWMPVARPWLGDDRLVLVYEERGMRDPPSVVHRIVDLRLEPVEHEGELPELATWTLEASEGLMIAYGGAELAIVSADGVVRVSSDPRTSAAYSAALLGPVAWEAPPEESEVADRTGTLTARDGSPWAGPVAVASGALLAMALGGLTIALRRPASPDRRGRRRAPRTPRGRR